jgi:hypothetical protein
MRMTKRTVIHLDDFDTIEVQYAGRKIIVSGDPDRHKAGPIIDSSGGVEMILPVMADEDPNYHNLMEASYADSITFFI